MKSLVTLLTFVLFTHISYSQGVGINETGSAPDESAILHVESESGTKGVLLARMTTAQRDAIVSPAQGLTVFNTETNCYDMFDGVAWRSVCGTAGPVNPSIEKPRMLGYGGGLGTNLRTLPATTFQDVDVCVVKNDNLVQFWVNLPDRNLQYRAFFNDWPNATHMNSVIVLDGYLYVMVRSNNLTPNQSRVYRYELYDIDAGFEQMNVVGQVLGSTGAITMTTGPGGGIFYFNYNAGNTFDDFEIAKYQLSGTDLIYLETVTFGNIAGSFEKMIVDADGNVYGVGSPGSGGNVRKFGSVGGAPIYTTPTFPFVGAGSRVLNWDDTYYFGNTATDYILNRIYLE